MKTNSIIFILIYFFLLFIGLIYGYVSSWQEMTGFISIIFSAHLSGFIAFYLFRKFSVNKILIPSDNSSASIHDDTGLKYEYFSPWSWSPILIASFMSTLFLGFALNATWLIFISLPAIIITLNVLTLELYRNKKK